ncbi:protein CROWDED NUCLEI 2-like [Nasonia vitripennis]|uniref:Uncharacterized protein n=1 Tax=Nasonia vitripennis TaxID=7425 RepID=A0A7M7HHJ9_NASVI|nr:protein CROWDED NUCLEI 2-like [Nasonia vitripennis]XP_008215537.1 protein CROWDED NUCLEI 2-like [Nasonia vitripennis]
MSFFHEPEGLKISVSDEQIQEEVEDQEDQQRRNEEIKNLLTNAFDDLDNDENSSVNSSSYLDNHSNLSSRHFQNGNDFYYNVDESHGMYNGERGKSNTSISMDPPTLSKHLDSDLTIDNEDHAPPFAFGKNNVNPNYLCSFETPTNRFKQDETSASPNYYKDNYEPAENVRSEIQETMNAENHYQGLTHSDNTTAQNILNYQPGDQLDVLNAIRIREIDKLTLELRQLQTEKDEAIRLLERKLTLSQVEIERLNVLKNETEQGLANATSEISDLKLQIEKLKEANKTLEKSKQEVIEKLSVAENTIYELEQKVHVLEDLDYGESNKKLSEKCLQQMQEDHSLQLRNMQTQMDAISRELDIKNTAYDLLQKQYAELREAYENYTREHDNVNSYEEKVEDKQNLSENDNSQHQLKIVSRKYDELKKIYNILRQKCLSSSDLKSKDSESLQREKQLHDLQCTVQYLKKEKACYSSRVKVLEQEYINKMTSQTSNIFDQIAISLNKLNEIMKVCNNIEKRNFKLSKQISITHFNRDTLPNNNKKEDILDASDGPVEEDTKTEIANKSEYDSSKEIVQLRIELQEVQKELDRVKELYIDVCATKDRLALDFKNQLNSFKTKQQHSELQQERDSITQKIKMHIATNKQIFSDCVHQLKSVTDIQENVQLKKNLIQQDTQTELEEHLENGVDQVDASRSSLQREQENLIHETTLKEMKKKMEAKVVEELRYIKSQYEQKYKTDLEKYEKVLLLLRRELKEKNVQMQLQQESYLAEKLKITSDTKMREEQLVKLVEAKMLVFQKQILLKNEEIENLNSKIVQTEMLFEEDKTLMAKIMSEWISEIQNIVKKNSDLEKENSDLDKKLKESEELNVKFCTEVQALKKKAASDFQLFKKKYELIKKSALNYKEYARKKEEYVIHQCKRVESGYKKALEIIKQKIEALIILHEKGNYLLRKHPLKSAR